MTSLHVICGLAPPPPNQKSWLRLLYVYSAFLISVKRDYDGRAELLLSVKSDHIASPRKAVTVVITIMTYTIILLLRVDEVIQASQKFQDNLNYFNRYNNVIWVDDIW